MAGSLRRRLDRGDDVWELRVALPPDPLTGRRRQLSRIVRGGRRAAERALAQLVTEADGASGAGHTVDELLDAWLEHLAARGRSARTLHGYREKADRYLRPSLGRVRLDRLRVDQVDRLYTAMAGAGRSRSISGVHAVLRGALNQARRWRWVRENVATLATLPTLAPVDPWAPDDATLQALLTECEGWHPELYAYLVSTAALGLRRSEGLALRADDVDEVAGTVTVSRALERLPGWTASRIKSTKTHATGALPVDADTIALLLAQHERNKRTVAELGFVLAADAFLWPALDLDPTGRGPRHPDWATHSIRRLRQRPAVRDLPGVSLVTVKSLRHWAATTVTGAHDLSTAQRKLRHRHVTTTQRYSARVAERDRAAAETTGRLLQPASGFGDG
jgi:integrase